MATGSRGFQNRNWNARQQGEAMISAITSMTSAAEAMHSLSGAGASPTGLTSAAPGGAATPFSELLTDAVGQVNQLEAQAHAAVTGLMTGTGVDVHQAMIATEKSSLAFEMALSVRNKAVQAYQSVIGMQF
jgi:flagellar hook-basal body complex protein FliE